MSERTHWTPTHLPPVVPAPAAVVDLVARLVESDWPTTDEERQRWFREFGLLEATDGVYWDSATEPDDAPTNWHTFEGQFVGANWFIWAGWSREAVDVSAAELNERLSAAFGSPLFDELDPRGSWLDRTVENEWVCGRHVLPHRCGALRSSRLGSSSATSRRPRTACRSTGKRGAGELFQGLSFD